MTRISCDSGGGGGGDTALKTTQESQLLHRTRRSSPLGGVSGSARFLRLGLPGSREERKKVIKITRRKIESIDDSETFLRRSVLVNNLSKRLQREDKLLKRSGSKRSHSSCSPEPSSSPYYAIEQTLCEKESLPVSEEEGRDFTSCSSSAPSQCQCRDLCSHRHAQETLDDDQSSTSSTGSNSSSGSSSGSGSDSCSSSSSNSSSDGEEEEESMSVSEEEEGKEEDELESASAMIKRKRTEIDPVEDDGYDEETRDLFRDIMPPPISAPPQMITLLEEDEPMTDLTPSSPSSNYSPSMGNKSSNIHQHLCDSSNSSPSSQMYQHELSNRRSDWTTSLDRSWNAPDDSCWSSTADTNTSSSSSSSSSTMPNKFPSSPSAVPGSNSSSESPTESLSNGSSNNSSMYLPEHPQDNSKHFSCGQSSMFGDIQSVVYSSLIASLET